MQFNGGGGELRGLFRHLGRQRKRRFHLGGKFGRGLKFA